MVDFAYWGNQTPHKDLYLQVWDMTRGICAVDIETISLDNREPIGIGFAPNPNDAFYFPIDSPLLPWHLLENPNVVKLMHNGSFDLGVLKLFFDMDLYPVYDSIIAAHLQGLPLSLDALCQLFFNKKLTTIEDLVGPKGKDQLSMDEVPFSVVADKCCQDVLWTYSVWDKLVPNINWAAFLLDMDYQPIAIRMEDMGLRVDLDRLDQHKIRVEKDVTYFRGIAKGMGFNPGSSKQVAAVLESRGWSIKYSSTGNPKLNEQELSTTYREDPISHLVLNYRKSQVLLSTFIEAIYNKHLVGDRIYPRVNLTVASTGRQTRTKPNTQNIPPNMRDIFIPTEGNIYEGWDLSQIELRILAFIVALKTGDLTMQKVFENDPSTEAGDIHQATANFMGNLGLTVSRRTAKDINFASVYRGTEYTLWQRSGIPTDQGKLFLEAYFTMYPGVNQLFAQSCQQLREDGYTETLLGRRRHFPEIEDALKGGRELAWLVRKMEREAFNHIIQGTAGEDLKQLQVRNKDAPQCNTIHDEITFDIKPGTELQRESSSKLAVYRTPMEIKQGNNWKDMQKLGIWG
jgi:DNA polymerase-1